MKTRTSSPALCSWMRAPSTLYSKSRFAQPFQRGLHVLGAGLASMGETGERSCSVKRERPAAPSSIAARATRPTSPEYMAACRTTSGARPAALAMASQEQALESALPQLAHQEVRQEAAAPRAARGRASRSAPRRGAPPIRRHLAEPTSSNARSTSASVSACPAAGTLGTAAGSSASRRRCGPGAACRRGRARRARSRARSSGAASRR